MSQQQVQSVRSLLDEVEKKSKSISPESPQGRKAGLALINSDLQMVQQEAMALPGEEGLRLQALCLYEEARIRVRFAAHENINEVNKTIRLLERAIELGATENMYFLLGVMCMESGRFDQARKALNAAKECDGGILTRLIDENLSELDNLEKAERPAKSPWTTITGVLDKLEKDRVDQRHRAVVEHEQALHEFHTTQEIKAFDRLERAKVDLKKTEGVISPKLGFGCLVVCIMILVFDALSPRLHWLMMLIFGLILGVCFLGAAFGVVQMVRRFMRKRR